ncbi:membrane protein [Sulfurimonas hongkongensis]|uniref:Membrane protein n=1 Tax=Sulfurimonas hongkongensis TaxID=1172190 RepID=T0L3L3_9BACT|nr:DMT family transporter [Sulfurimonas hongkongensis]EQB40438.1 membrane protein [Sulfurimonas hongkongensis]
MIVLSILESWFPILSIVAISHIGALHTYAFSLFVSLFFFIFLMLKKGLFKELKNRAAYKDLLLTSFYITTLFALVFIGMQFTTAGNMSVIIFTQLFFSYLYFNIFGKEKIDLVHSIGAFIMGLGAIIILIPDNLTFNKGDFIILVAAAIAPIANFYSKRARGYCSSITILGFRTIIALPVIAFLAWLIEPKISLEALENAFVYLLLIGLVIFGISKILWMEALYRISITKISAMIAFVPPMTLFFAFIYLDEVPGFRQMLGIIPVLIGGYLLIKPIKSKKISV